MICVDCKQRYFSYQQQDTKDIATSYKFGLICGRFINIKENILLNALLWIIICAKC